MWLQSTDTDNTCCTLHQRRDDDIDIGLVILLILQLIVSGH